MLFVKLLESLYRSVAYLSYGLLTVFDMLFVDKEVTVGTAEDAGSRELILNESNTACYIKRDLLRLILSTISVIIYYS